MFDKVDKNFNNYELISELIDELDDLYDELRMWDKDFGTSEELECIKNKISVRKRTLDNLTK